MFLEWMKEERTFSKMSGNKTRVIFMDNSSSYKITDDLCPVLRRHNTEIIFLPKHATDLCQPADSFVIEKVKTEWRASWDEKRMDMTTSEEWKDYKRGSGKLSSPGKKVFLKLGAALIKMENNQRDGNDILCIRKAVVRSRLACNLNGVYEEAQLFPNLQEFFPRSTVKN